MINAIGTDNTIIKKTCKTLEFRYFTLRIEKTSKPGNALNGHSANKKECKHLLPDGHIALSPTYKLIVFTVYIKKCLQFERKV